MSRHVKIIVGDHTFAIYHDLFDKEDLLSKSINRAFSRLDIKLVIANPFYLLFALECGGDWLTQP